MVNVTPFATVIIAVVNIVKNTATVLSENSCWYSTTAIIMIKLANKMDITAMILLATTELYSRMDSAFIQDLILLSFLRTLETYLKDFKLTAITA